MDDVIAVAIDKAHAPSVIRALKTGGISTRIPRSAVESFLKDEFEQIINMNPISENDYDKWAIGIEKEIVKEYHRNGITDYTLGNAQKLVSMAMKYIFSADNVDPDLPVFKVAHIPIDKRIMDIAKSKLGVQKTASSWSKIDDENEIITYQKNIRVKMDEMLRGYFPMIWECENWK